MGNAIEEQQAIRDNTTEGVGGLTYKPTRKEINARALEEAKIKKYKAIDKQAIIPSYAEFDTPTLADFRRQEVRSVEVGLRQNLGSMPGDIVKGYGESKYDKDNAFLDDLTEHRASAQSFLTKAGNWLGQAGSTALYSTIGGLGSIPAGLIYGLSNENGKGFWTNFIDNPFSQTLNKAQEQANDYFKFNLTEADEKAPWWKINGRWASGSAQAVGFVAGMIIPGMAATKLTSSAVLGSMKLMNRSTNFVSDFLKLTASEADEIVATAAKAKQLASVAETAEEGNRILSEIPKLTQQIAQTKKTADGLSRVIASGVNTSYEASIEALGTKDNIMNDSKYKETLAALDYKIAESKEALLNDPRYSFIATNEMGSFKLLNPEGQKQLAKVEQEVNNRKKDLIDIQTAKADSSMKQNYVINSLVVGASNYALFGRGVIDRFTGRKTLLNNITKADGVKVAKDGSKVALSKGLKGVIAGNTKPIIKGISKSVASAIREGGEEAAQAFSNSFLQKYNLGDVGYHTFTEQVYNKESVIDKAHKASSIWDNMKSAADDTFSGDNMIGIMLGAAMGIVGIPITRKEAKQVKVPEVNEDGTPKLNELGQPLTSYKTTGDYKWGFSFHPLEEIKTIRKEKAEREALVDQINDRLEKKGSTVNEYFNDYFKNSNLKYVTEYRKTNALDGNDKKAFNDEQMTELIGDYVLFSKLGKQGVESLKSIPQQLANLSENTTSGSKAEQDQLKLVYELFGGKEVVEGGITHNDDGEVIDNPGIYNGANPNDIFSDLKRKGKSILEDLDMINKNAINLKGIVDPNMSEDAFNELVYLTSRIDDFRKRGQEIGKIIDQNIKTVGLDSNHYFDKIVLDRLKTFENGKYRELFKRIGTDKSSIVKFALEHPDEYINVYNDLLDDDFKLTTEQKTDFKEKIKELNSNKVQGVKSDTLINLTNDLATIRNSRNRLMSLYTGIMENPEELEKTIEDIKNKFTQDIQDINTKVKEQSDINREINTLMDFQTQLNNSYNSGTSNFVNTVSNLKAKKYSILDEKEKKLVDISDEFEQTGLLTGYLNNQIGSKEKEDLLIRSVFYGDKNNQVHLFNYNFKRFNKAEFDRYKQEMLSTFNNRLSSGNFNQFSENVKSIARKKLDHTLDEAWKEVNKTIEQIKIEHEVDTDLIVDPNTGKVAKVKTEPVVKEDIPEKPIVTPKTPVIKKSDKIDGQPTAPEAEKIADDNAARVEINKENAILDFNELPDVQGDNINGDTKYTPRDNMSEYMKDKDNGEYKYSDNFGRTLQPGEQDSRKGIFAYFTHKLNLFFKKDSGEIKLNPDQKVSFVVDMEFINYELVSVKSKGFNTDFYPIFITTEIDRVTTVIGSLSSGGPGSMYDILNKSLIEKYGANGENLPKDKDTRFVHVMKSDKEQYTSTIKQVYPSKYLFQPKNGRKRSEYYKNLNSILTEDNTGIEDKDKLVVGTDIKFNFIPDDLNDAKKGSGILEIRRDDGDYDTTFILTKKPSEVISKEEIDSLDKRTNTPLVHKVNELIKRATTIKTKEDGQLDYKAMAENVAEFRYNQFGLRELFYLGTTEEKSNITYNIEINILNNNSTGKPMLSMIKKLNRTAEVVASYSIDLDTLIEQNKDNTALQNIADWLVENTDYFNFNRTSSSDYLKYLLDKGVFTTDLVSLRKKNMWFSLNDLSIEESKEFVNKPTFDKNLAQKIQDKLQKLYPEIELNITNNPVWEQGGDIFNQEEYNNQVNYRLKATKTVLDNLSKIKQWESNKSIDQNTLWRKIQELGISKQQLDLLKESNGNTIEEKLTSFVANYSYSVEVNTAIKEDKSRSSSYIKDFTLNDDVYSTVEMGDADFGGFDLPTKNGKVISEEEYKEAKNKYFKLNQVKTSYYSNLTVPGGTNYTENEIATPLITPSIKGHGRFSTDNGIGWFRSDDLSYSNQKEKETKDFSTDFAESSLLNEESFIYNGDKYELVQEFEPGLGAYTMRTKNGESISHKVFMEALENKRLDFNKTNLKTRRILEVQSDLFQKGRDRENLVNEEYDDLKEIKDVLDSQNGVFTHEQKQGLIDNGNTEEDINNIIKAYKSNTLLNNITADNMFIQLLNKDNNWVTFFIKSIIQDSAKKGYEKVLFPKGETAAKIEGHETIADEIKRKDNELNLALKHKEKLQIRQFKDGYKLYVGEVPQFDFFKDKSDAEKALKEKQEIYNKDISRLEQEKANLKSQGVEKLKPIEVFYEIKVGNILEKQFGKDNVKTITDEFGNQWREITINQARDLQDILLQKDEANRIIGQANVKAMTVLIDVINQKQDTLPHEYAHHYIAWFRDTPIVQEAIKKWGSEEALVQSIGEQVVKQKGEAYNWWNEFVKWIMNQFNSLSKLQKEELTQILTDAFLTRRDLGSQAAYEALGFGQENNTEAKKADIERRRQEELNRVDKQNGERWDSKDAELRNKREAATRILNGKDSKSYLESEQAQQDYDILGSNIYGGFVSGSLDSGYIKRAFTPHSEEVNAKYDAELKSLNNQITPEQKQQAQQIEQKKQDIIEGKDSTSTGPKISFNNIFGMSAQNLKEISEQTEPINKGEETDNIRSEITKIREELKESDGVNYLERYDVVTDGNYNELILKNTLQNTPKYEYYDIDLSKANPNNEATGRYMIRIDTANNTYSIDSVLKDHVRNIEAYESAFNLKGPKLFGEYTIIPGKVKKTNNGYEITEKGTIHLSKNAKQAANFLQTGTIDPRKNIPFTEINKRLKGALINNGITEKVWNSYDIVEKDEALKNLKSINKKEDTQKFKEFVHGKPNSVKPGVEELFDSNPELANSVYEALGFDVLETKKADIEIRRKESLYIVTQKDINEGNDVGIRKNKDGSFEGEVWNTNNVLVESYKGTLKEVQNAINAKYDAEIDALESTQIAPQQKQEAQSKQSNDSEIGVVKDTIIKRLLKDEESSENSITFAEIDKSLDGRLSDALKSNSKTPEELWSNLNSAGKIQLIDCL